MNFYSITLSGNLDLTGQCDTSLIQPKGQGRKSLGGQYIVTKLAPNGCKLISKIAAGKQDKSPDKIKVQTKKEKSKTAEVTNQETRAVTRRKWRN